MYRPNVVQPYMMKNYNYSTPSVYPSFGVGYHASLLHYVHRSSQAPNHVVANPKAMKDIPEKSSYWRCCILVSALILLIILVVVAVVVPLIIFGRSTGSESKNNNGTASVISTLLITFTTTTTDTTSTATTTTSTAGTTVCSSTAITTTVTSNPLPVECSTHTVITDNSRNAGVSVANYTCDQSGPMTTVGSWFRFSSGAGTMLASCVVPIHRCSAHATGWYSGIHPSTAGTTINGTVCYNWGVNTCSWSNTILVTNCNGFYVYFLRTPPVCTLRYCTI